MLWPTCSRAFSAILGSPKTLYPIAFAAFSYAELASTSAENALISRRICSVDE
jgi:hypothetical protein